MPDTPFEVPEPIICVPYDEPDAHWHIVEGEPIEKRVGRRPARYFYRPPGASSVSPGSDVGTTVDLPLVNDLRVRVKQWRAAGYPGVTRTTLELLTWWRRDGRAGRFFFAQLEAVETVIFLVEAREDFRQGVLVPRDEPSDERKAEGYPGFKRYAAKMATGTGKTMVMGMLAAWSILNKQATRNDARFSDGVFVVCPNVTIRDRLAELDPDRGDTSIYRTRDIVPPALMPQLRQGKIVVSNWHILEPQDVSAGAGVDRRGPESDTALVNRVLKALGGRRNVLIMNDEAHHAYRVVPTDPDADEEEEEEADEYERKEATVWIDGLDKVQRVRGINLCIDLSATPYYLARVGQNANTPFPWVVSDFSLIDAIESGLVKIPQLAVRDTTGAEQPAYFNIWRWILPQLTTAERGGRHASPRPEAILKFAHTPIALLAGEYGETFQEWATDLISHPTPPVFIVVCRNTRLAGVVQQWISGEATPLNIPPANLELFRNEPGQVRTIRVDTKVIEDTNQEGAKDENLRWMRYTLDTVGRDIWPQDSQGRVQYPKGFEELADKLQRPLHPPGRDIRCIVSVGMLTEGWDCRTVTHILGLRPFDSQLLCEQVVGRGLRRTNYDVGEDGKLSEEVAKVLGVPFEVVPFKQSATGPPPPPKARRHIYAIPDRAHLQIRFPRVVGYTSAPNARITVNWEQIPPARLEPGKIPPEVEVKALLPTNSGRPSLHGPGELDLVSLRAWRAEQRVQHLSFQLATTLTKELALAGEVPAHEVFRQVQPIVARYLVEKVQVETGADVKDLFLSPYYGWAVERLFEAIRPDTSAGAPPERPRYESHRPPGSTNDVDFWTGRDESRLREALKTHVNLVVMDTDKWEQEAAYYLDAHPNVEAFAKNVNLGFAVPYLHNGEPHDFEVDYLVRLAKDGVVLGHLLLEPKGFDPLAEVKQSAALRWCEAVTAEGSFGPWAFRMVRRMTDVRAAIDAAVGELLAASET